MACTDADDRRTILGQLQNLCDHENTTFQLLHNQITVTKAALESRRKPLSKLNEETDQLVTHINEVKTNIACLNNSITYIQRTLQIETAINGLLHLISQVSGETRGILEEEVRITEAGINQKFHHGLINLENLHHGYQEIIKYGGGKYINLQDSIMKLVTTDGRIYDDHIIARLVISLPAATKYQVKRCYAIPIPVTDKVSQVLKPKATYTATSTDGSSFNINSLEEIEKCVKIIEQSDQPLRVCSFDGPLASSPNATT